MVFWFAYSFYLDGTLGVLVAVIGVFSNGMSFVYGMVYLLHKMGHLMFGRPAELAELSRNAAILKKLSMSA